MEKIDSKENFIRLINQYKNLIFSICLKLTGDYFAAEDLTQETFISAYQHWDEFEKTSEKAWLCRIASNKSIDYCRAASRSSVPTEEETLGESLIDRSEPLQNVLNQEVMQELEHCCKALSPPYNEVALKHFLEGRTAKEIAEQSGVGLNTVKTQIYRAREMLKKSYRKEMLME